MEGIAIIFLLCSLLSIQKISNAVDTITETRFLKDGDTIVSSDGSFEMGFFSPGNSNNRYVGIWYKKISVQTVVWVANRQIPLINTSGGVGVLKVINPGILVLFNATNKIIWSSNTSRSSAQNPIAQLLDSGNLVVREANDHNPNNFLWQSFDYPTDTLLPGMKMGSSFVTGIDRYLSSWKSSDDPAPGEFTYHCDSKYPELILKKGSVEEFRTGQWNGVRFSGSNLNQNSIYEYGLVFNNKEVYYSYRLLNRSVISRYVLNQNGLAQRWNWIDRVQGWVIYLSAPRDSCDTYSLCGAYSSCNIDSSPVCACLDKFVPKQPEDWARGDWSKGCVRKTPLDCNNGDGFLMHPDIRLPDTRYSWFNKNMNLQECRLECLKNCNCTAYANLDISDGGSGCMLWFGDLIDIRDFPQGGQEIYIRMASSELDHNQNRKRLVLILGVSTFSGMVVLGLLTWCVIKKMKKSRGSDTNKEDIELPLFDLATITTATNNFSGTNMIGEGGFGQVYKGKLSMGQEIAVKRLSRNSGQGLQEFKNEIILISKLQHLNLVRLLGCCLEREERMLIYEYMPNKSLDYFIFDQNRGVVLTWQNRFEIAIGVAKGLLYLHQDSRLRIVHRDLKASNVLLDAELNPKISDFGIARIFERDQIEAKTNRVIGTYGYMSPEYAIDGKFSVKSDVFSFGVLLIEIVCGKRNTKFRHPDHYHNLLGHAWLLWNEGKALELVDARLEDSYVEPQVLRCIHVGLLCVQKFPKDRLTMSSVVFMLDNESMTLPEPKQPGFFIERSPIETATSTGERRNHSQNAVTITMPEGR